VLNRMQVQYREIRGGFECIHLPSIDLSSVINGASSHDASTPLPRHRTIARKVSRLSFGRKGKERELPERPATATIGRNNPSGSRVDSTTNASSVFNVPSTALSTSRSTQTLEFTTHPPRPETPTATVMLNNSPPRAESPSPVGSKFPAPLVPPGTGASTTETMNVRLLNHAVGEVDNDLFENTANNGLCVRFEVNIVKVPWLPLHGIQFRRVGGDAWQYQMLARRVLTELKL